MRERSLALLLVALVCTGCEYPRDVDGTSDQVRRTGQLRVGLIGIEPADRAPARRFIAALEHAAGARARFRQGPAEPLLAELEAGGLDLVLGDFAEDSPWADDVALIEPLTRRIVGERVVGLAAAARNGENRWIALLEHEVRKVHEAPQ